MNKENICPVMGHPVEDITTAPNSEYEGKTYYFCCPRCKEKFDLEPAQYLGQGGSQHHHKCHCH